MSHARFTRRFNRPIVAIAGVSVCLGGCVQRSIVITSEPPGAIVWLNDVELGRTPVETEFKFYGTYDVRLALEGYEPLVTSREAVAPFYEYPGVDLFAAPLPLHSQLTWHFDLARVKEATNRPQAEADVIARAQAMRAEAGKVLPKTREGEAMPDAKTPPASSSSPPPPESSATPAQPATGAAGTPATVAPSPTPRSTTAPAPTAQP